MAEEGNDNSIYQVDTVGHLMMICCYDMFQRMEAEASQSNHGGKSSCCIRKHRDKVSAHDRLMRDYFADRQIFEISLA